MANINNQPVVKISGYLEKKAKLRIGSPWKKYWFVLEGRLLLYYRSKDEYETLSPCKGSINLCPPCNIKPALSAACVFQIECRASTVTLRAESRQEQERWMQALLAAIAQSKSSPSRMSHFRYSLDDLPMSSAEEKKSGNPLSRQNTMPYRISSSPKPKRDAKNNIIERLQNIGAQTYGGSLSTITKLANKDQQKEKSKDISQNSETSQDVLQKEQEDKDQVNNNTSSSKKQLLPVLSHKSSSSDRIPSIFIENEQYSIIQEENSLDLRLDEDTRKVESSEKVKSLIVENDEYVKGNNEVKENMNENKKRSFILENDQYINLEEERKTKEEASFIRNKEIRKIEHLYERISNDSSISEYSRISKVKQNSLYERISTSSSNSDTQINKTNAQYSIVHKDGTKQKTRKSEQENEYSVPVIDHNKNTLLVDNDQYIPAVDDKSNDDVYSDGLIYTPEYSEYAAIDKTKELEDLYEDPDHIKKNQTENSTLYQDIEPILPPRPDYKRLESSEETSSQTSSNESKKPKHKFKLLSHLMKFDKKDNGKPSKTKRRSTSFLHKVWRRKAKSLDSDDEITYETVDYEIIEKQISKDKNDLEMLQELQKILETRKTMLQVKLNSNENKGENSKKSTESKVQPIVEDKEEEPLEIRTDKTVEEVRPSLPPRQSSQSLSPYHDVPQNNQAVNNVCDNKSALLDNSANSSIEDNEKDSNMNKLTKNIKTIDDILKDLDEEKDIQESRQKVRQLIEKFNEIQNEDEVILRRKAKTEIFKSRSDTKILQTLKCDNLSDSPNRESDELTILLEELSKVTCAPVLTPGVTSSLVNPVLTDEEWLQLIPIRRRRLSDPDYDVPRPHRSLQLHGSTKQVQDNPIPATRFFGPILPPSSTNDNMVIIDHPSILSIDPDSLELEHLSTPTADYSTAETDYSVGSYISHDYPSDDKVIYAHPKAVILNSKINENKDNIYSNINNDNKSGDTINDIEVNIQAIKINKNNIAFITKSEETFIDSLEPLAEISTAF